MKPKQASRLAVCALFLAPWPAAAQPGLAAQLSACLREFGAIERLACYDNIARSVAGPSIVPAPAPLPRAPVAPPAIAAVPPAAQMGSERLPPSPAQRPVDRMTAQVTDFSQGPDGRFRITLSNGQVWQQIAGDSDIVRTPRSMIRTVKITRGSLGSYNLVIGDSNQSYKVTRLQ